MVKLRLIVWGTLMILASMNGEAQAAVQSFNAQPLAPGVFGLTWESTEADATCTLYRQSDGVQRVQILARKGAGGQYIDQFAAKPNEAVTYRIVQEDGAGKELAILETAAANSANLVFDGNFERAAVGDKKFRGLSVSVPAPWTAQIVKGGRTPGGRCLEIKTSDPDAPGFYITTPSFIVSPKSSYYFSWWTTNGLYGCAGTEGQGYAVTRTRETSFHAKTPSLYIYENAKEGNWIGAAGEPALPDDIYYITAAWRSRSAYQPEPILFDDIRIRDADIELLQTVNVETLVKALQAAAKRSPTRGLSQETNALAADIQKQRKLLATPASMSIDRFLDARATLCSDIRRLQSLLNLYDIAAMNEAGTAQGTE